MEASLENRLLEEVNRIGGQLLEQATHTPHGMAWKTMDHMRGEEIFWKESESLYKGTAGILLFLLYLGKTTDQERFLKAAEQAGEWLIWNASNNPTPNYALYSGRMSTVHALLELFKVTQKEHYVEKALTFSLQAGRFLLEVSNDIQLEDFINGYAGTLWELLNLYEVTKDERIYALISSFAEGLIRLAKPGIQGLYWGAPQHFSKGMCGFSHGASGFGYLFLELDRLFDHDFFRWVVEQTFEYERFYYSNKHNNWPEMGGGIFDTSSYRKYEAAFFAKDNAFFANENKMNAWCHGAAGIGLSRILAYSRYKQEGMLEEAQNAMDKVIETDIAAELQQENMFVLCHGGGGNADLFIESAAVLNDSKYLKHAEDVAQRALNYREKFGFYRSGYLPVDEKEDGSLFMGNAGIGYFFLRLLFPKSVPSVLAPQLDSAQAFAHQLPLAEWNAVLKEKMLNSTFPRCLALTKHLLNDELMDFLALVNPPEKNLAQHFVEWIKGRAEKMKDEEKSKRLLDLLALEEVVHQSKCNLSDLDQHQIKYPALLNRAEELLKGSEEAFFATTFGMDVDSDFYVSGWTWEGDVNEKWEDNLKKEKSFNQLLIIPFGEKGLELELDPLMFNLLVAFGEGNTLKKAMPAIKNSFDEMNKEQAQMVEAAIIEKTRWLVKKGLLQYNEF